MTLLRLVDEHRLASGFFIEFDRLLYETPDGRRLARDVIRHPGAVAFLPIEGDQITLMRQHRVAVGADVVEVPAGKLDVEGEDLVAAVTRECEEEVGLRPETVEQIGWCYTSPGFTDERIWIFEARDLTPVEARPEGYEEEQSEVVTMTLAQGVEAVQRGDIVDAKTVIAIMLAAARRA